MSRIIAAIATPIGQGGVSIIRVSGVGALAETSKFIANKDLVKLGANTITYGYFVDEKNNFIDEILVSVFKAPHSFTGDDTVEINCHGGIYVTNLILETLITHSIIELAQPGEFTKQSFLNGKKSLIEVESTYDIINAKTKMGHDVAISKKNSKIDVKIQQIRGTILELITTIEVNIDYPEYEDVRQITIDDISVELNNFEKLINVIINESKKGELIKNGISTCIVGEPNVGKSSLLNHLSGTNKAIVTDLKGTTRDLIESTISLSGLQLNLIDTAGIRKGMDEVEKIGIQKSFQVIENSDLVILMVENKASLSTIENQLLHKIGTKKCIIVVNKVDNDKTYLNLGLANEIPISLKDATGIEELEKLIFQLFELDNFEIVNNPYIGTIDYISKLQNVKINLHNVRQNINAKMSLDLIEIDLKEILFILGDLLGIEPKEDLLDELFSKFCLGK